MLSAADLHRVDDLLVARASAEVAGQRLADVVLARVRNPSQEVGSRDHEARRTEPALHGSRLDERCLHRVERRRPPPGPPRSTISCPSACAASTRHEQTSLPSSSTEHDPHSPCSHAFFEPGSPSRSRSVKRRLSPGQTSASIRSPLTDSLDPHAARHLSTARPRQDAERVPPVRGRSAHVVDRRAGGDHGVGQALAPRSSARERTRARGRPSRTTRAARRARDRPRPRASRRRSPSRSAAPPS